MLLLNFKFTLGENIRRLRLEKKIGQTELVKMLQLAGIEMTRESLVKIERGIQHLKASQLKGIKEALNTTYDELLK
ncbi:MAG: helix-turn-helix transcriptional regulator [Lachnospiraceae bacterium]|nr:helix-turn-helix transcriptional regulator [Lachnospiraceae bacterium]